MSSYVNPYNDTTFQPAAPTFSLNMATLGDTEGQTISVCAVLNLFDPLTAAVSVVLAENGGGE